MSHRSLYTVEWRDKYAGWCIVHTGYSLREARRRARLLERNDGFWRIRRWERPGRVGQHGWLKECRRAGEGRE